MKERVYSVLVVSAAEKFNAALAAFLPESTYSPVLTLASVSAAKRALTERAFDFVVINSPLPDDPGIHFAMDAGLTPGTVVLLLVRSEGYEETCDKVMEYGVFTLSKPTTRPAVIQALRWMAAVRERLRKLEKKSLTIEEKMEEIRLVNRAKWILISELKMSEADAQHYLEKQAMDRCLPKKRIAEDIVKTYT